MCLSPSPTSELFPRHAEWKAQAQDDVHQLRSQFQHYRIRPPFASSVLLNSAGPDLSNCVSSLPRLMMNGSFALGMRTGLSEIYNNNIRELYELELVGGNQSNEPYEDIKQVRI